MIIPERVDSSVADRRTGSLLGHMETQPVLQAQAELLVQEMEAERRGRDYIQPIPSVTDSRVEGPEL
jgi:hypothetical protein